MISREPSLTKGNIRSLLLFFLDFANQDSFDKPITDYDKFPTSAKSLIQKYQELIEDKRTDSNPDRLELLKKFHIYFKLFAKSKFLSKKDKDEFCEFFKDPNSPFQLFIESIETYFESDRNKTRETLNDALEFYSRIVIKYHDSIILKLESLPGIEISDEDNLKIFNDIIFGSLLNFFGKGDDNPFLCLDGTRMRLVDARLALDTPPLYSSIMKEIIDRQVANSVYLVQDNSSHVHLPALFFYLLYPNSEEINKIDSFFRIGIQELDLRIVFEFIKQFPKNLELATQDNIANFYLNITLKDENGSLTFGNYSKFLDNLNQSLQLSKEEKLTIESFFDSENCKEISQEESIVKITEKYNLLLERKFAKLFPSSSINLETINYFQDFSCDLFYEDSSIPDPKKIDNLIRLFETPEQFKKGLVILGLILSGYKISCAESDLTMHKVLNDRPEFLELYFDEFLKKFEQRFQVNFIDQFSSIDSENPQYENIKLILDFNSKKIDFSTFPFFLKYCQIFHLGIAKTPSDVEKFALSQDQILSTLKLQETQLNLKIEFSSYLIKYHQEALLQYFFKSNEFELNCDEAYDLLRTAFELKNFGAILAILKITPVETREELIQKHLIDLIYYAINFSSNEALKEILEFFSQDILINSLKENLDRNKLNLFAHFVQVSSEPSILSSLITKFQELGITLPDINYLLRYQDYPNPETLLSVLLKKESYELFKILFESYSDNDLFDQDKFKLFEEIHAFESENLNILRLACQHKQPKIFKLIFERHLELQKISASQLIEQPFEFKGQTFNLLSFAIYNNSYEEFLVLVDYYSQKEDLLKILLNTKIKIEQNGEVLNMLEYCYDKFYPEIFKTILDLYKNYTEKHEHIAEIKILVGKTEISLLSAMILKIDHDSSMFESLVKNTPFDKLVSLLFDKNIPLVNGTKLTILEYCLKNKFKNFSIFLAKLKEASKNLREILEKNFNTDDSQSNLLSLLCIELLNQNPSQKVINKETLQTIASVYSKEELLDLFSNGIKAGFRLSEHSENVDFITACCLKKNSNLLEEIINLIPENKLLEFFKKYLETPQNHVFSFLRKSPKLACLILVRAIKENNSDFLEKFLHGYDLELEPAFGSTFLNYSDMESECEISPLGQLLFQKIEDEGYSEFYDSFNRTITEDITDHGHSLLTLACFLNKAQSVKILLRNCPHQYFDDFISICLNNPCKLNAFGLSIIYGNIELLNVFFDNLQQDYDIKKILDKKANGIYSVEFLASNCQKFDIIEFLIKKKLEIENKTEINQREILLEFVKIKQHHQLTLLHDSLRTLTILETSDQEKFIEFFSKLSKFLTAFEIQEYINDKDLNNGSSIFDLAVAKKFTNFAKQLVLSGSFITKPSNEFLIEENYYGDKDYNSEKFKKSIYLILREIKDEEISQEKITNPIAFSNLLLLKAIADSEELSEQQKIATIDKLIEETKQDKSLVDMIIEGYKASCFAPLNLVIRDAQGAGASFGDPDGSDQNHNWGFLEMAQGNSDQSEFALGQDYLTLDPLQTEEQHSSAGDSFRDLDELDQYHNWGLSILASGQDNLTPELGLIESQPSDELLPADLIQENPIELFSLLNPEQSEQGKFIEKEQLNDLAINIRDTLNACLSKRKRGIDDTQAPESMLKKLKEEFKDTRSDKEESSIELANHNTEISRSRSETSESPSSPKGEAMTSYKQQSEL